MDWHRKKKAARNISRIIRIAILMAVTYWLYSYYKAENLAEYQKQNAYTDTSRIHPVKVPTIRDTVIRQIDSIKRLPLRDSQPVFSIRVGPSPAQNTSSDSLPAPLRPRTPLDKSDTKNENHAAALHGPSALFSRVCTIAIGKTVPVNILWEGNDGKAASLKLITIRVDDIADSRARFTIEDPFNVLLFSQAGYAAHDKIVIQDEKHDLTISVAKVTVNSAVVNVESRLNDGIVSGLQKVE